jgi:hypothetical protein
LYLTLRLQTSLICYEQHNRIQNEYTAIAMNGNGSVEEASGQVFFPDDGYPTPRNSEDSIGPDDYLDHQQAIEAALKVVPAGHKESNNYLREPLWWLGIVMMVFGELGNFIGELSQFTIQPFLLLLETNTV